MFRWLKLLIAGRHRWSRCWMGFHPWDMPGGHGEKCGKCDEFFVPHRWCREAKGRAATGGNP